MRIALVFSLALGLAAGSLHAQTPAYVAEVTADSVAVRSGPSAEMPDTGQLYRGTQVVVDHEEPNGWLAIQPPAGQVSWIKHLHLGPKGDAAADTIPRNAIVHADAEAEIAYGRPGAPTPLDVRRTRVPDQTIVLVVGQKVEHAGSFWYPIAPPHGDFRYVPSSEVRLVRGQAAQSFVVRTPKSEPPTILPATASIPNGQAKLKPADWPSHPVWQQADQAEKNGEYSRAETLYLKLAAEMNQAGGDADLANLCYTRVHAVREKQRPGERETKPAGRGDLPETTSGEKWVGPGVLRPAGFRIENRPTYAIQGPRGETRSYAVAGSGVDLERFKGYEVDLYGQLTYPGDLRGAGVMTVTRVQLVRVK